MLILHMYVCIYIHMYLEQNSITYVLYFFFSCTWIEIYVCMYLGSMYKTTVYFSDHSDPAPEILRGRHGKPEVPPDQPDPEGA
jgi:hypothetical protein